MIKRGRWTEYPSTAPFETKSTRTWVPILKDERVIVIVPDGQALRVDHQLRRIDLDAERGRNPRMRVRNSPSAEGGQHEDGDGDNEHPAHWISPAFASTPEPTFAARETL